MSLPRVSSIRAILKFPARVAGADGITVTSSSGVVTTALDILSLPTEATPAAGDYVITYNISTGVPNKALVSTLITTSVTAFDPLNIAGNYSVASADAGRAIFLTGGNMGTLTFTSPINYSTTHGNKVFNESTRRWSVVISGKNTQWLWPGQFMEVARDGASSWGFQPPPLWAGPTTGGVGPFAVNLFCDALNGNDDNDGLITGIGGAIQHIQKAVDIAEYNMQAAVTIQCAAGTYSPAVGFTNVIFRTGPVVGKPSGCIEIVGDSSGSSTARQTFNLVCPPGGSCVNVQDGSCLGITGFTCRTTGVGSVGISGRQLCICDATDMAFGDFPGGIHISAVNGASIGILASGGVNSDAIVTLGTCSVHLLCGNHAYINYGTFFDNIVAPIGFAVWVDVSEGGEIGGGPMHFRGAGAGAASSGQQYVVALNGIYVGNGATLPGTVAGATFSGGQALP